MSPLRSSELEKWTPVLREDSQSGWVRWWDSRRASKATVGLRFHLSPGTVLAVFGSVKDDGKFQVEDHCFADLAPQNPVPPLDTDR